jgi:hypothetical protein
VKEQVWECGNLDNGCESVGTWIMDVGVWGCQGMGVRVWESGWMGVSVATSWASQF